MIIDLFSRKVIAYKVSLRNSTQLITSTFKQAYAQRNPSNELVFHSDRGVQFTSYSFQRLLRDCQVKQSFSNSGKPHDNAVAESFFASMKQEELYRVNCNSEADFRKAVERFITHYNTKRPHAAINYKTPDRMENPNI